MTSTYTPTGFVSATYELMTDGDQPAAQLFRVPLERLADGIAAHTARLEALGSVPYAEIREDFIGAVVDDSGSSLLTCPTSMWRTNRTFSPAINPGNGGAKNPGLLVIQVPTDAGGCVYEFHPGTDTGAPISYYNTFESLDVVVKIEEDAANISESVRFGLVDDASLENGGSDCLCIWRNKGVNATKWLLLKRVSGIQTVTTLTAADFADGEFAVWRLESNPLVPSDDVRIYLNGTLVHTVAFIALPSGQANLSFWQSTGGADTEVMTVTYDLIRLRTFPGGLGTGDRSGA
jgi:hypothetical protein